jgi:hypothetical protein
MNAQLAQIANLITEARVTLEETNAHMRVVEEGRFEEYARDYVLNHNRRFAHGGLVNALYTLSRICEEKSQLEDDRWERCARLIDECAADCDELPGEY